MTLPPIRFYSGDMGRWAERKNSVLNGLTITDISEFRVVLTYGISPIRKAAKFPANNKIRYGALRKEFLEQNDIDIVALFVWGIFRPATIIHHAAGRKAHYANADTFIATTQGGDDWIHEHVDLARELGFICGGYAPRKRKRHPRKKRQLKI